MTYPKLTFTIPGIPPSYNLAFKINYRLKQTYLTASARKFKDQVAISMPYWPLPDEPLIFAVHIKYYDNWYYKNGKVKRKDCQNLDKLLIDAVFKAMGRDDSFLFRVTNEKVQCATEKFTVVELEVVSNIQYNQKEKKDGQNN